MDGWLVGLFVCLFVCLFICGYVSFVEHHLLQEENTCHLNLPRKAGRNGSR